MSPESDPPRHAEAASSPGGAVRSDRHAGAGVVREGLRNAFAGDLHFVICVVLLSVGAVSVQLLKAYGFQFSKERLDLKAPLTSLDQRKILPYRLKGSDRIPKEEVEALGTEEYIRWRLEDTSVRRGRSPLRWPTLFVTYYSGQPDQVPHVPEECFLGGGYQQLASREVTIKVPELEAAFGEIPLRIVSFQKESAIGGATVPSVAYLFSVNGKFVASRNAVRWTLSNPFEKYGYFAKVEVSFGRRGGPEDPEVVRKAAERLLGKLLPVLVRDHLPDWPPDEAAVGD